MEWANPAAPGARRPLRERLDPAARLLGRALPWLSLFWGVASGALIARRFDMASRVLAFAVALFVASVLLGLWSTWVERERRRAAEASGLDAPPRVNAVRALALRHQGSIDWAMATGTQIFAQYLLMFSLPFLWYARAWGVLALAGALVASTLWDPLFLGLVRRYPYRLALRAMAFALVTSFVVGALLPRYVQHYAPLALVAALVGGLPWRLQSRKERGVRAKLLSLVPTLVVGLVVVVHARVGGAFRFPLLAVWVKGGAFALQDAEAGWATDPAGKDGPLPREDVEASLARGGRLCCVSPLVAPRALQREVVHEWWLDGRKLDTILLPLLQGRDEGAAYRTFSCKRNLPAGWAKGGLSCHVFVGRADADAVEVGRVTPRLR